MAAPCRYGTATVRERGALGDFCMPLGITVSLLVLGAIVATGIVGYLIDRSEDSEESREK